MPQGVAGDQNLGHLKIIVLAHLSHRLNVSNCDHWMSVIIIRHLASSIALKDVSLLNYWLDFDQTWQE